MTTNTQIFASNEIEGRFFVESQIQTVLSGIPNGDDFMIIRGDMEDDRQITAILSNRGEYGKQFKTAHSIELILRYGDSIWSFN